MIVVIAAILWTATARIMYNTALVVLSSDFVMAATAIGVSGVGWSSVTSCRISCR